MAAGLPVVVSDWDGYKDTVVTPAMDEQDQPASPIPAIRVAQARDILVAMRGAEGQAQARLALRHRRRPDRDAEQSLIFEPCLRR